MNLDDAIEFVSQEAIYHDEQFSKSLALNEDEAESSAHYQKKTSVYFSI